MANEVVPKQNGFQGTYQLYEKINGKLSWKSATHAIWYRPQSKRWIIGPIASIGEEKAVGIYAFGETDYDCPQQVPNYFGGYWWDGSKWHLASSNDVNIQCTGKKEQYQKNLLSLVCCKNPKSTKSRYQSEDKSII